MEIKNNKGNVIHTNRLDTIISYISKRGFFNDIVRYVYDKYDLEEELQIVEAIGKQRNSKFRIDNDNRFCYENFIRWAHCDKSMQCLDTDTKKPIPGNLKRGIYIAGSTGTGKSWAMEIMQTYCRVYGFKINYDGEDTTLCWQSIRSDAICEKFTESGTISQYKKNRILCVQDFGSEPTESLYMGNRLNVMRNILESRGDRTDLITLITSNLPINHEILVERYDARVASRLVEMCNYFEMKGIDRRSL